jgi:AcrR family transcriptional regulator
MAESDQRPPDLPIHGWRTQRETAGRNERAIVEAATALMRERGTADVEVRDIAARAGVGVGTVYRRFGDKASLIAAVLGEQERALQDALLSGPAPLGPGAPAAERLVAFLEALCALTEANLDVLAASEGAAPGSRRLIPRLAAARGNAACVDRPGSRYAVVGRGAAGPVAGGAVPPAAPRAGIQRGADRRQRHRRRPAALV